MTKHPPFSRKTRTSADEVGSAEFKARCLELIDHVRESHAEYVVTRHGRPVARLVPVDPPAAATPFGTMKGTVLEYERPYDAIPAQWSLGAPDSDAD